MYNLGNIKIEILETYEDMSKRAAEIFANEIKIKPDIILGLATGTTPIEMYKELIKLYENNKIDFSKVKTFNLDEYYPLSKNSQHSYHYFMDEKLFNHVNINRENIYLPNGEASDPLEECNNYEVKLKNSGGIDLQLLGLGLNGHIGFNEPSNVFSNKTQLVDLTPSTIEANSRLFESIEDVPKKAITMGIKTIMMAKKILLIVNGEKKANIIKEILTTDINPENPATVLQLHQDVTILLDKPASLELINFLNF